MPVATAPAAASDPLYLYGGVALPPFPAEWDRETYPYALIDATRSHKYRLAVFKSISYYSGVLGFNYCGTQEEGTALVFESRAGETIWSQLENTKFSVSVDHYSPTGQRAIWTNFDLMYSDNTLYVGASEPERITDWDALKGKCFYNDVVLPDYEDEDGWGHRDLLIMKHETEDVYIMFSGIWWGYYCDKSSGEVFLLPDNIYTGVVHTCPAGGNVWVRVADDFSYYGEKRHIEEYNWDVYYFGKFENIVWAENDVMYRETDGYIDDSVAFYGSEQIPVPVPEPSEVNTDNKAIVLGCRLGYIVRKQMQKRSMPDGVLTTSDGHILKDSNGLYLCAMKGE